MRDFQEFIDKNIAVTFADKKELRVFYELCLRNNADGAGVIIENKEQALESYVYFSKIFETILVHFQNGLYDYKIVPASEFLQQQTTIEIFRSNQTVVCLKKQGSKVVAVGKAKCNPEDQFNFDYGAKLAYERMEMDIVHRTIKMAGESLAQGLSDGINGIKTLKNGMRIKKQDSYEVGDRVLMKKKQRALKVTLHTGEIGVITKIGYSNCYKISFDEKERAQYYSVERIKGKVIQ